MVVRLRSDFPQRPRLRRAFLLQKGFTESDVRVFGFVLDRTVHSPEHKRSAQLSVNRIASDCGLSRSTVIRAIKRLSDGNLIEVSKDPQWNRHRASEIRISPSITEVVGGRTSVKTSVRDTSFGKPGFREHKQKLRRQSAG
jgi:DNA-binding MarR family transcriptional regulator